MPASAYLVTRLLTDPSCHDEIIPHRAKLRECANPKLMPVRDSEYGWDILNAILDFSDKFGKLPTKETLYEWCLQSGRSDLRWMRDSIREWDVTVLQESAAKKDIDALVDATVRQAKREYYLFIVEHCHDIACNTTQSKAGKQLDPWTGKPLEPAGAEDAQAEYRRLMALMPCQEQGAEAKGQVFYTHDSTTLYVESADSIEALPIEWIWPGRIPRSMIGIMSGPAGCGKTFVSLYMASRVTTGQGWIDGAPSALPSSDVLILSSEDDYARTIVPRLRALGADLSRIKFLTAVKATDMIKQGRDEVMVTSVRELQLKADIAALTAALHANPSIALIIIDPITGYFGCDQNKDKELKPVMTALKNLCEDTNVTVVCISHLNKKTDADPLQRILGGSSFVGTARAVWTFSRDTEDSSIRHMAMAKLNIGEERGGLKYRIKEAEVDGLKTATVEWLGETQETAETLQAKARERTSGTSGIDRALLFLTGKFQQHCEHRARDLYEAAEAEGLSEEQVKRARYKLGGIEPDKRKDGWWWMRIQSKEETVAMAAGEAL